MFPIGFLIVIISLLVISYLAGDSTITSYLTNSDAIFLPGFYSDIFGGSGHIDDWHRPPPGFIFPDYIFFLAAYVFGKNIFIQIAIFIAIQAMATFVAVYLLMKQVLEKDVLLLSILAISVLAWCALNAGEPFVFMLVSVHHYGIFISGVLFWAILLKYLKCASDQRQKFLLLLSIFSVVCVLSDLLFLIQVLIPLVFWGTLANYWGFEKGMSSISIHAFELVEKNGFSDDFYPDYIACIDGSLKNFHLVYGIAQYWDAKHIQAFSKQKIVLAQHWSDLQEQKHITSDAFFKSAYDFAIISEYAG
jgi:hypothetical protein